MSYQFWPDYKPNRIRKWFCYLFHDSFMLPFKGKAECRRCGILWKIGVK